MKNIKVGQKALCVCTEWCESGLQVAIWNGKKFTYSEEPNNNFDNCVTGYLPLGAFDRPTRRNYLRYKNGINEGHG